MATPEMLNALLQQIGGLTAALQTQQAQQAAPPAPGLGAERAPSMNKRLIDGRHLKIPVFDGEPRKFDDWAFAFKRTIRSVSREAFALLAKVEMESGEIDEGLLDVDVDVDLHAYSAELYDILCQACTGEALSLVRAVEDMLGITAWNKLFRKYKPRTMARAIRLVGAVTNPPKIKDLKDVESELDKWEELIKVLKKDFGEEFSDTVKVGIVTSIMPQSIQELVYTSVGASIIYETVAQRIRAVVSNKVAMMTGPSPMDIGKVDFGDSSDHLFTEEDVGAVSMSTQCHGCGGWGHFRRDCPTAKSKGKGMEKGKGKGAVMDVDKGKGKGDFRGFQNAAHGMNTSKGWKGASKGFKGACHQCGVVGHFARECPSRNSSYFANSVEDVGEHVEEVPLGGVWVIAAVDAQKPTKPMEVCALGVEPAQKLTRPSAIQFNVADVRKPLASAVKTVRSRNRVVLDEDGSYIQNKITGECMEVKIQDETFVFDVEFENGENGTITLDSGAGVNVWPKDKLKEIPMIPRNANLKMSAANGTEIKNYGQKIIKFFGIDSTEKLSNYSGFTWQA